MRGIGMALVAAVIALTVGAGSASAANYAQESLDRNFRIEFQVSTGSPRPEVAGYVYNLNPGMYAERVRLSIERLDAAGRVIGSSSTWLLGGVPANNRGYFSARVEPAASYRIQVQSFDWGGRGGASN